MIYLMRTKENIEKGKKRREIQSQQAKNLLLYGLKQEYALEELPKIQKSIDGKPYFSEMPEIFFNYSHADAGILCGIAEVPIGVDIERLIQPKESFFKYVCHENEQKLLRSLPDVFTQERMISRIWTAKESYLKCLGIGIRKKLSELDLSEALTEGVFQKEYQFDFFSGENFAASVCIKTDKKEKVPCKWIVK